MKNLFTALFRTRDKPRDSVSAAPIFYFGNSGSGKAINAITAIQLPAVYACVRVIPSHSSRTTAQSSVPSVNPNAGQL